MANLSNKLRAYFLGELKEEEGIRLENEYLGDEAKLSELLEAENDLLDDYIYKRLPPISRRSFEENYLNSPFRYQRLAFAETLAGYLQKESESFKQTKKEGFAWHDIFSFWKIGVAFASIVLLLLGGFWLMNNSANLPDKEVALSKSPEILPTPTLQPTPATQKTPAKTKANEVNSNLLPTPLPTPKSNISPAPKEADSNQTIILALSTIGMRDGGKTSQAIIGKETKNLVLRLSIAETEAKVFQVKILNADGEMVYQTKNARISGKNININLSANILKNDDYVVEVSTVKSNGDSEKISNYSFRVIKK